MLSYVRTAAGLVAAFAVSWIGALILGEYPFTGWLPIVGGFLLGVSVVGAAAFVERDDPPVWAIVVAAGFALWGEWRAAWIDSGAQTEAYGLLVPDGIGPLPWEAWAAIAAAGVGALVRLIPKPRRDDREPDESAGPREADEYEDEPEGW